MKLVCGVGINDADYAVQPLINGKQVKCPYYETWKHMLLRCYSDKWHDQNPTYKGCSAVKEWLTFSNFKNWMIQQDWQALALDKDIIEPNNKVYGPDTCCFVSKEFNNLLTDCAARRGDWPQGVSFDKRRGKFRARICICGKEKHLGSFFTPEAAYQTYLKYKMDYVLLVAHEQNDSRIKQGLMRHAAIFEYMLTTMSQSNIMPT